MDHPLERLKAQNIPTNKLVKRIGEWHEWLKNNTEHPRFKDYLKLYEILVEEVKKRGVKESDCWFIDEDDLEKVFGN